MTADILVPRVLIISSQLSEQFCTLLSFFASNATVHMESFFYGVFFGAGESDEVDFLPSVNTAPYAR